MSLALHVPDAVDLDQLMSSRGERAMGKALVKITTESRAVIIRTLLLTNRTMYEFSVDPTIAAHILGVDTLGPSSPSPSHPHPSSSPLAGLSLPPLISIHSLKEKPLTDLHSLSLSPSDPHSFHLFFFSGSLSHRAAHSFTKLRRLLSTPPPTFHSFVKQRTLTFATPHAATTFYLLLSTLLTHAFHRLLEAALLPPPEYYQRHAFVLKGAKDRMLLLSSAYMYNVEVGYHPLVVRGIKWCIGVQAVKGVGLGKVERGVGGVMGLGGVRGEEKEEEGVGGVEAEWEDETAVLVISFDVDKAQRLLDSHHRSYKKGGAQLTAKEWHFVFRGEQERGRFVQTMQKVYHETTGQHLKPHLL